MMWNPDPISQGRGDQGPGLTDTIQGIPLSHKWGAGQMKRAPFSRLHALGHSLGNRWLGTGLDMLIK